MFLEFKNKVVFYFKKMTTVLDIRKLNLFALSKDEEDTPDYDEEEDLVDDLEEEEDDEELAGEELDEEEEEDDADEEN